MSWVKLDDALPDHPKLAHLPAEYCWLFVCSICYANRYKTNGYVPDGVIDRLCGGLDDPIDARKTLVSCGLWELPTDHPDDFLIHDYLEYQPSKEDADAKRLSIHQKKVDAGRKRATSTNRRAGRFVAGQDQHSQHATSPVPVPVPKEKDKYSTEFEEFWSEYPERKGGKWEAWVKYGKRLEQGATDASLLLAARNYRNDRLSDPGYNPRYTKHASAFLYQRCDEDYQSAPASEDEMGWLKTWT